jgi:hypothetical protein
VNPILLDLVACDALRGQFPRGVPRRACLRRQLQLRPDGKDWAPAHPGCAGCELGRQVRAEVEAAGVILEVCERHGAAIMGEACDVCEAEGIAKGKPCPGCGGIERHAPSGCARKWRRSVGERVPATYRGPVSTVIWSSEVPDVPIAAPTRHGAGLSDEDARAAARRVREALAHPTAIAAPPPDAAQARRLEHATPADTSRDLDALEDATSNEVAKSATPAPRKVVGIVGGHHGLGGGTDASAVRLEAPRQTTAWTAVMTDQTCRCGCGRQLRKNNTSGWSGYCNPARYAAGERPPRPSRAKESTMPCRTCGKAGHNARGCTEKKPEPKSAPPAQVGRGAKVMALRRPRSGGKPGDVDALLERREGLVTESKRIEAEIGQVNADLLAALAREEQRVEKLRTAVHDAAQRAAGGA